MTGKPPRRGPAPTLADPQPAETPEPPRPPEPGELAPGDEVDRYVVEALLGQGGMARVYRVRHQRLGSRHALKVVDLPAASFHARILREGRAQARLQHPNIVAVTDVIEVEGAPGLVMELVEGPTLAQLAGKLPLEQALRLGRQVIDGVAAAHRAGFIHRDLKPTNVLVATGPDGQRAKVADFGLVKLLEGAAGASLDEVPSTRAGLPMGTPGYMAPEQIHDASGVDARADVFALGAVLHHLLTGRHAFAGDDAMGLFQAVIDGRLRAPEERKQPIPAELDALLMRCLAADPAARPADGSALLQAYDAVCAPLGVIPTSAPVPATPPPAPAGRPWVPILGGAALLAAAAVGVALLWPNDDGPPHVVLTQLTHEPGLERQPALSADGGQVIYSDGRDLLLRSVEGERAVTLTADLEAPAEAPALSPDGAALAFSAGGALYLAGPMGESPRLLVERGHSPSFSPDGRTLAFTTRAVGTSGEITFSDSQLWSTPIEGGEPRSLLETNNALVPDFSPDGRHIVFVGWEGGWAEPGLWVISSEGGEPWKLGEGSAWSPRWDPSGRFIWYLARRGDVTALLRQPVDPSDGAARGEVEQIALVPTGEGDSLAISGDGRRLVIASLRKGSQIYAAGFDPVAGRLTSPLDQLTMGSMGATCPQPSPDGRRLAWVSSSSRQDLYVGDARAGSPQALSQGQHYTMSPRWTPDGAHLVFQGRRQERTGIWRVAADGGGLERISGDAVEDPALPLPSPDGARLAFTGDGPRVYVVDMDQDWDAQVEAQRAGETQGWFATSWSPQGHHLAMTDTQGGLALLDTDSFEIERLEHIGGFPIWMPDGERLLVGTTDRLELLQLETGAVETVADLSPRTFTLPPPLALSPDGERLYLSLDASDADLWLVELD